MSSQNCLGGRYPGEGNRVVAAAEGSGQHHPPAAAAGWRGGGKALFFELKEFF